MITHSFWFCFLGFVLVVAPSSVSSQAGHTWGTGGTSLENAYHYYYDQQPDYPRDCTEVLSHCASRNASGVYHIKPDGFPEAFEVYCDNGANSSGWTVISRRHADATTISFARTWGDYKLGFGFLSNDFWIGNERLSHLTNQKNYQLLIEMTRSDGSTVIVSYGNFRIGDEYSGYRLLSLDEYGADSIPRSWCPVNMVYGVCTCGRRLCSAPANCQHTCTGGQTGGCICPDGFYMSKGGRCIPQEQCGCYVRQERTVVPDGETFVNAECTRVAACSNGRLTRNERQRCSPDAVCEERRGVRACHCNDGYSGDGLTCSANTDCMDVYNGGTRTSGVYRIKPTNWPGSAFEVFCNMSGGGGWTVFQRRVDGRVGFYLDWNSYKRGFGNKTHDHWLGNDKLHYLTNQKGYTLLINLVDRYGNHDNARYTSFVINNEADNYRLSELGAYRGTAGGDSLRGHLNAQFSTKDRDNDGNSGYHCAIYHHSAWWFTVTTTGFCRYSDLNAELDTDDSYNSLYWDQQSGNSTHFLKFSEMKLKPTQGVAT